MAPASHVLDLDCPQIGTTKSDAQCGYNRANRFWQSTESMAGVDVKVGGEVWPRNLDLQCMALTLPVK